MTPADPTLDRLKAEARRRARAVRAAAEDAGAGARLIVTFPRALQGLSPVAGYWPLGSEIDPRPLLMALMRDGAVIALPRMVDRAGPPRFLRWRLEDPLSPDAFGVLAPPDTAPEVAPALVLCPLLAFDRAGGRLGQGGGHYDRILARLRPQGAIAAGLAYAAQEVEAVPMGPLDARLDWIVTDLAALQARPGAAL